MFDAGGISGFLNLDTSGFTGGMLNAEAMMQAFPQVVTSFLANPLLGFIEVGKMAADAAIAVGSAWLDAIKQIGGAADDAGETAAKLGVSTEFLTGWGAAFADAGSSAEGLADALKFLNKNAAEAAGGSETAVKAFNQLGISQDFVKANLGNTEAMARKVFDALGALPTAAQRTNAAMDLLGRGGADLGAGLAGGSKGLDEYAATMKRLGATIDTETASQGDKFGTLEKMVDAAITGMKKSASQPILKFLADHFEDIKSGIETVTTEANKILQQWGRTAAVYAEEAFKWIKENKEDLLTFGFVVADVAGKVGTVLAEAFRIAAAAAKELYDQLSALISLDAGQFIQHWVPVMGTSFGGSIASAVAGGGADPGGMGAAGGGTGGDFGRTVHVTIRADASTSEMGAPIKEAVQQLTRGQKQLMQEQAYREKVQAFYAAQPF